MRIYKVEAQDILQTANALASNTRINIINLLLQKPMSVTEIADSLQMPVSSAISAVLKLEKANLVTTRTQGSKKICSIEYSTIMLMLSQDSKSLQIHQPSSMFSVLIGSYVDYCAVPSCGLLGKKNFIGGGLDDATAFELPEKNEARLIWFRKGYLEYRIKNPQTIQQRLSSISISAELCSEFPGYNNNFPSEIYLRINEKEIGIWKSAGDFGGKQGVFTPSWWGLNFTQYGNLTTWSITKRGSYVNGEKYSDITIDTVIDDTQPFIAFRIGTDTNGGMNIFGKNMGNYNQDIFVQLEFDEGNDTMDTLK